MRKRRLAIAVTAGAILLLLGRAFVFLYTDLVWYQSLGAGAVWREKTTDQLLLFAGGSTFAFLFAYANLAAVRHSIISLVLPRRIANVEFGEAVPVRFLDAAAAAIALMVALATAVALPSWTDLARVRTGVKFGEADPYHQLDLAFYTSWLPLENAVYSWMVAVVTTLIILVIGLYALTPSLRWSDGALRVSGYVRRHLGVLGAVVLLMIAWKFRLESYELLSDGSGAAGAFTAADDAFVLPWYVGTVIILVAAAAVVGWSTWTGQLTIAFGVLTLVLLIIAGVQLWRPVAVGRAGANAAYAATRRAFTARAFPPPVADSMRTTILDSLVAADRSVSAAESRALVAPGANGYMVVSGIGRGVAAPSVAPLLSRLAHAWREQDGRVLGADMPADPRIVRVRDLYDRVYRVAPVFSVLETHRGVFHMDTLYWVVPMYSASGFYPLSERRTIADTARTYFREAARAYVHSVTGRVTLVASEPRDPLVNAWRRRFPNTFRSRAEIAQWANELTPLPRRAVPSAAADDGGLHSDVRRLYLRMQEALARSDLAAFGQAFDSLGAVLRDRPR
ncbi:MAG TPA: UPF0182 family protein [Gemmatimonadaceae bacterium]|nr:UPF0182 family protein [Gemmatimonadaceae bacterium]